MNRTLVGCGRWLRRRAPVHLHPVVAATCTLRVVVGTSWGKHGLEYVRPGPTGLHSMLRFRYRWPLGRPGPEPEHRLRTAGALFA